MKGKISALLVYDQTEPLSGLRFALENQFVRTSRARTCADVMRKLEQPNPPHIIFTDPTLQDGTWLDVLGCAARAPVATNVIVVARHVDVSLSFYRDAMEQGAFDFLIPPFDALNLWLVVQGAPSDVLNRRQIPTGMSAHPA